MGNTSRYTTSSDNFKLAICEEDLQRIDPIMRRNILLSRMDLDNPTRTGRYISILFTCDILDAAMVCDIIRSEDRKAGQPPSRIYLMLTADKWERVSNGAIFTVELYGKVWLNPVVFGIPIPIKCDRPKRLVFGKK